MNCNSRYYWRSVTPALLAATCSLVLLFGILSPASAAPPDARQPFHPEKVLPEDTLLLLSAQSWPLAKDTFRQTPFGRLWNDASMRPFREKFRQKFDESVIQPLERELEIKLDDYFALAKGPITFAVTRDGWASSNSKTPGWILLVDTGDKAAEAKKKLATARKRWTASNKALRAEMVAGQDFTVLQLNTNSALHQLRRFFPRQLDFHELGRVEPPSENPPLAELWLGQADRILVIGSSSTPVEKIIARISGGAAPTLAGEAGYAACQNALFRDAPVHAWLNARTFLNAFGAPPERTASAPPAPTDMPDRRQIIRALGLDAITGAGLAAKVTPQGFTIDLLLNSTPADHKGLVRLLAGDARDVSVPPFIPADVVSAQRWRIDGSNALSAFQKMMSEISPQWTSTMGFIIDTANQAAQLRDPSFDVRKNLLGNLGDDFVTYRKPAPAGASDPDAGPSITLLGSPQPEQFAAALHRVLIFLSAEAENPQQRDFLGRKIYSVPLPSVPLPFETVASVPQNRTLHYSTTSGYVALATDAALLEEFLRSAESNTSALKDKPGLREAAAAVATPSTSLFLYEDQANRTRISYEFARVTNTDTNTPSVPLISLPGMGRPESSPREWFDLKLLPPFEKVSQHFGMLVRASKSTPEGIRVTWLMPAPNR